MKKIFLIVILYFPCLSFALSARELSEYCSFRYDGLCVAYVSGFFRGMEAGQFITYTTKNITVGTLINIFKKEMHDYPEQGDIGASLVLSELLLKHHFAKPIPLSKAK